MHNNASAMPMRRFGRRARQAHGQLVPQNRAIPGRPAARRTPIPAPRPDPSPPHQNRRKAPATTPSISANNHNHITSKENGMFESIRTGLLDAVGAGNGSSGFFGLGGRDDSPAEQFASWLPYSAYISGDDIFVNRDGLGFMLEIMPQSGADDRMVEVLVSLYSTCPKG